MFMYKIGVVGDRTSILGFKALGLSVFPVTQPEQASRLNKYKWPMKTMQSYL